ncbi:unnamed protein product, partial [Prorocentrum cordatum]
MGMVLSFYFGGFVLHALRVRPTGLPLEAHQFDGLWKAQALAALLPLLSLPLLPALMPRATQVQSSTSTSLWDGQRTGRARREVLLRLTTEAPRAVRREPPRSHALQAPGAQDRAPAWPPAAQLVTSQPQATVRTRGNSPPPPPPLLPPPSSSSSSSSPPPPFLL